MTTLIFATNNQNKVAEINSILNGIINAISLKEANIFIDIPEPHNTLEANATEKSTCIYNLAKQNCFSEDTGLEVEALNGLPGVKSARFAEDDSRFENNIDKLLYELKDVKNRKAQFKTIISLIIDGEEFQFTGICKGEIISSKKGENGFGYDAIFIPAGSDLTFAEMDMNQKNIYSHRKKATIKLIEFLNKKYGEN